MHKIITEVIWFQAVWSICSCLQCLLISVKMLRMKPNNQYTSPENRFFYPVNHGIEHHESLDTTGLPGTENIPGQDHYVVIRNSEGEVYAAELGWNNHNIPVNTVVIGVKGQKTGTQRGSGRSFLNLNEFDQFDEDCTYTPNEDKDTKIIVQVDMSCFRNDITDPRFNDKGVAVLPQGTLLPSFAEDGIDDEKVKYRLLGFINPEDKLVTWHGETGYNTVLVDWCVANQLKQNRLEEVLLHDALPSGAHLVGLLSTTEAANAYLEYFDRKHGTSFMPKEDPRHPFSESKFERLSELDYQKYRKLAELAHHFMTNHR